MRLAIDFPEGWSVADGGARATASARDARLLVVVEPLVAAPDDVPAWIGEAVRRVLGDAATLEPGAVEETTTVHGWPVELIDVDAASQRGLVATYRLAGHAGMALAVSTGGAGWPALRACARSLFLAARPDWRGRAGVAGIAELFT